MGAIHKSGSNYVWVNKAGVSWKLIPDFANERLLTQPDCPYYRNSDGKAFTLIIQNGTVTGFRFNNESYSLQ